jgi:hypothetical protein
VLASHLFSEAQINFDATLVLFDPNLLLHGFISEQAVQTKLQISESGKPKFFIPLVRNEQFHLGSASDSMVLSYSPHYNLIREPQGRLVRFTSTCPQANPAGAANFTKRRCFL